MVIRSDYTKPKQRDYVVERCLLIHQEAVLSWASLHDLSRMHSPMLGNISEMVGQVVGAPLG